MKQRADYFDVLVDETIDIDCSKRLFIWPTRFSRIFCLISSFPFEVSENCATKNEEQLFASASTRG